MLPSTVPSTSSRCCWSVMERAMAEWVFVALGSNLGDRAAQLAFARERLAALPDTTLVAASAIEETAPLGPVAQGPYLNQMVLLSTELPPRELLEACAAIERSAGPGGGGRRGAGAGGLD